MIIIAALFTALLGPYFVNWTTYKQTFETEATRLIGQKVTVGGRADLRLLPSPKISFTDVRIGSSDDEPIILVERVVAEIELSPLISGQIRVLNMTVERPSLTFDLAQLDGPDALSWKGVVFDPDDVSLSNVEIQGGKALISDSRTQREWQINTINGQIDARSLIGPAQIEWGAMIGAKPVSGRLSIGRSTSATSLPVTVTIEPPQWPAILVADGDLRRDENGVPGFEGTLQFTGHAAGIDSQADDEVDLFATLEVGGGFLLTPDELTIPEFDVSVGPADRPVQFVGEASMALGAEPRFDVAMSARQIDLDRSLGGGPDDPVSLTSAFDSILARLEALPIPEIDGEVRIDATGIVVGGSVIKALGTDLTPIPDGWRIDILSAILPGATRLDVSGDILLNADPSFKGNASIRSQRPSSFSAWWRPDNRMTQGLEPFSLKADLTVSKAEILASSAEATFGGGTTTGNVQIRSFAEREERFATIDLSSDRLDIDQARAIISLFAGDAMTTGAIDRLSFDLHSDAIVAGGVEASTVIAKGDLQPDGLQLQNLSIADLAGAQIIARGNVGNPLSDPTGRMDGSIVADDLTGSARFLDKLLPDNAYVKKFVEIAPYLAPASTDLSVILEEGGIGSSIDMTGQFAGTSLSLTASGAGDLADISTLSVDLNALLVSQDTSEILSQIGLNVLPLPDAGPARLSVDLTGSFDEFASLAMDGEAAGITFQMEGGFGGSEKGEGYSGTLSIDSSAVDSALLLAGIALPGVGEGHSLSASGEVQIKGPEVSYQLDSARWNNQLVSGHLNGTLDATPAIKGELRLAELSIPLLSSAVTGQLPEKTLGKWPNATFAPAIPGPVRLDLALQAEQVDIGLPTPASNGSLRYTFDGSKMAIDDLKADFAGGELSGSLEAVHRDGSVSLDTTISLAGAVLQELVWRSQNRSVATGDLDLSFSVAGEGRSMSGLVSSLSGSGTIAIEDGTVRAINPRAFSSIISAADSGMDLDAENVQAVFEGFLDKGTLGFGRATGSFAVSGGVARISTMSIDASSATVLGSATFDLNRLQMSSDWSLKVDAGDQAVTGAEPEIGLIFSGPIDRPTRQLDVSPLLGFLTVRAFEQEVDRIEKLQADILEDERLRRELRLIRERKVRREQAAEAAERAAEQAAEAAERQSELDKQEAATRQAAQEREQAEAAAEAARRAEEEAAARQAAQKREQVEAAEEATRRAEEEAAARQAAQEREQSEAAAEAARLEEAAKQEADAEIEANRSLESEALARQEAERRALSEAEARRKAEERASSEAAARLAAEERAAKEAAARLEAEERASREAAARIEAERRAEAEAAARRAAEDRAALAATAGQGSRNPLTILEPSLLPDGTQPRADGTFQLPNRVDRLPSGDELLGTQPFNTERRATGAPLSILPPRIIQDYPVFEAPPRLQPLR